MNANYLYTIAKPKTVKRTILTQVLPSYKISNNASTAWQRSD